MDMFPKDHPISSVRRPGWSSSLSGELRTSASLATFRAFSITLFTLWLILLNLRSALRGKGLDPKVTQYWHGKTLKLAGVDLRVTGDPIVDRPVMMVSNHASYIDIPVLGSLLSGSFVSKAEVRSWPVFGWLASLQRTIFIKRDRKYAAKHRDEIEARLSQKGCLILFPEGTSTDGSRVLPFKSTLFQAATMELPGTGPIDVQPVSICYTRLDGMPMGRALRPFYTWYGDMELAGHLITWLGLGRLGIDVLFHEPVRLTQTSGRKELAATAYEASAKGLESILRGSPTIYKTQDIMKHIRR